MKKTKKWSLKKIDLKKFTVAALETKYSLVGGKSIKCTSVGCGNYECKPRRTQ